MNEQTTTFKNGLSPEEVTAAKSAFKKASLKQICKEHNLPYATIYNALRGDSPRVDLLNKAVGIAESIVKYRESLVSSD